MTVTAKPISGGTPVAATPATAAVANGAPVDGAATVEKPKKEPVKRVPYVGAAGDLTGIEVKDGKPKTLLTSIPTDYNPKTQLPPRKIDFADSAVFLDWRAVVATAAAARFTKQAAQEREMGDAGTRAEKKRLLSLTEKIAEIQKNLMANGVTSEQIAKLLASVTAAPAA